jgi:hypothetical protein
MIFEYVRNKKRQRIGVVVALDKTSIGWSACNIKKDRFDKELGLKIAMGRAEHSVSPIPPHILPTFNYMVDRAYRYYN